MTLVVDSSVAIAWVMPDEQSALADAAVARTLVETVVVPSLFWAEVANILLVNVRRGRIAAPFMRAALADISTLPLVQDGDDAGRLSAVVDLAERHRLTIYDATYLELARRAGAALATLDTALEAACREAGVVVHAP